MTVGPKVGFLERHGPVLALLLAGTLALGIVLAHGGVDTSQVGRAYLLSVGAIVIFVLVLELRRAAPFQGWQPSPAPRSNPLLPPQLEALQDSLQVRRVSRSHYELQVVPLLREIAADRLLLLGISLTRDPVRAAEVLGPQLSAALRNTRTVGGPPFGRGPQQRELEAVLAALEEVGR